MKRTLIGLLGSLLLLLFGVGLGFGYQRLFLMEPRTAHASQERTVMDITAFVEAGEAGGHCLDLPAGTLTITLSEDAWWERTDFQLQRRPTPGAVRFSIDGGYRWIDPEVNIDTVVPTTTARTISTTLRGGSLYCYSVKNTEFVSRDATMAELSNLRRTVSLRMVLS